VFCLAVVEDVLPFVVENVMSVVMGYSDGRMAVV
jgi:hypothetical protein